MPPVPSCIALECTASLPPHGHGELLAMPCEYSITHCTHVLTRHLGVPYSTVLHKLGASSLVPFKYPAILFRRLGHINAPKLSDSDYTDYSVVEGLRLMSQLKYVYFLLSPIPFPPSYAQH